MRLFIFAAVVPIITAPAIAQEGLQGKLVACADIEAAAERHACFDTLVPELKASGEAAFGATAKPSAFTAPTLEASAPAEPDMVSLAVKAVTASADGKLRFAMENGQVWKQIDTTRLRNLGSGPWTAEIRKASLGSFLLSLNDGRAVRVERVS
jgi:hypothetical protein